MIVVIVILTLYLSSHSVQAQEVIPYKENPIVLKEVGHNGAVMPTVLKDLNMFSLWYADDTGDSFRIYSMKSANGIDWYDKKDTNVTTRHNASDPFVTFENNEYTLYFASSNYGNISLWESKSIDGRNFTQGEEKEILKSQMEWEGSNLSCPAVIKDRDIYYLFYAGSGISNWGIGLATSVDGKNWQKCPNNPIIAPGASGQIIKYDGVFYLYFQTPNGLEVQQTNLLNKCDTIWTGRRIINSQIRDPAPVQVNTDLWLYGTLPTQTGLHIGLAGNTDIPIPTYPIVIIPGMFASWNKEAILHNNTVTYDTWKLNSAVTEYGAIAKTLENKGRVKNVDYFMFPYDWRAPLTTTIENLDKFVKDAIWNKNSYQPIQIIGHSLGGTITRLYSQKNSTKPIKNIVTAGSPLLGALQAYKPLAGGEIDRENNLMWIAEKLVLLLNKSKIESDKDTVTRMLPVLSDLLPLFPYLKSENGQNISSLLNNSTLISTGLSSSIRSLYLGGIVEQQMNAGYILGPRTSVDALFNIYPDGHPQNSWKENGDGVILFKSTLNQITPPPSSDHGQVIFARENIKTILASLDIQTVDSDIPEGNGTSIFPAILAFIQSPATIEIQHNGIIHAENEGMIWLQNIENGTYSLTVTGTGVGNYTVSIWLIGKNEDKWTQITKTTSKGLKNTFIISFDNEVGGVIEEYISPSPTLIPTSLSTIVPTPSSTPSPTPICSQSSTSSSSSLQGVASSLSNFVERHIPILNSSIKKITPTPIIKLKSKNEQKILGASTKNTQKKSKDVYGAIVISTMIALIAVITYKKREFYQWIFSFWKKIHF